MSVLMTLRVKGDAAKVEAHSAANPGLFKTVVDRGVEHGAISHRFYGNDEEILVIDEWPDAESFHRFFEASPEIPGIMEAAGVTSAPEITFWRKLDTNDDLG